MIRQYLTRYWNQLRWAVYGLMGLGGIGSILGFIERSTTVFWVGAILLFTGYLTYELYQHGWRGLGRPIIPLLILVTVYYLWMSEWVLAIRTGTLLLIGWGIISIFNRGTRIRGIVVTVVGILLWVYGGYVISPQSVIGGFFRNLRGTLAGISTPTIPAIPPVVIPPVPPTPPEISRVLEPIRETVKQIQDSTANIQQVVERAQQSAGQAQRAAQGALNEVKKLREEKEREQTGEDGPNVRHNKKYARQWID